MPRRFLIALLALALLAGGCSGAAAEPVRVMALGDSITQGDDGSDTYRYWLQQHLNRSGAAVDFVGSRRDPRGGSYRHQGWDTDHEAVWGLRTSQAAEGVQGWVREARPDVLLVHLGTNDVGDRAQLGEVAAAMRAVIAGARQANPRIKVLLAQIVPREDRQLAVLDLNQRYADLATELDTPSSPVRLVDCHTGFDPTLDTYDGIHPNESGERKIAAAFATALSTEFAIGPPPPSSSAAAPVTWPRDAGDPRARK